MSAGLSEQRFLPLWLQVWKYNTILIPFICCTQREDRMDCVLMTIWRQRGKCALHCYPKLLNQEDDLCCRECTGTLLSSHQSNPVDENPRTFKPFIVPSSGGVDTICYNNQGIMIYKKKQKSLALTDYGWSHSELWVTFIKKKPFVVTTTWKIMRFLSLSAIRHDSFLLLATLLVPLYGILN